MNLGLNLEAVREGVLNLLGHNTPVSAVGIPAGPKPPVTNPPVPLGGEHLRLVRDRIRQLTEQKDALVTGANFEEAVRPRDEVVALNRLLAWHEWHREHP